MAHADERFHPLFEFLHADTVVGKPAPAENLSRTLEESFFVAHVWTTDVQGLGKNRLSGENCEWSLRIHDRECVLGAANEASGDPRWNPDDEHIRGHVIDHYRAGPGDSAFADPDVVDHRRSDAEPGAAADIHVSAEA
ncbi:MAG TPA: hypothetical protein VGH90_09690, partial [Chthoniobacteraceae bacterium]